MIITHVKTWKFWWTCQYLLKFLLWKKKKSLIYLADYNLFSFWKSRSPAVCLSRSWYCKESGLEINASHWIENW